MLNKLFTNKPTIIAGDINNGKGMLKDWIQHDGTKFNPWLADSGVEHPCRGDHTIAVNTEMWQVDHKVGRSFESAH
jgi:hypothetical protein